MRLRYYDPVVGIDRVKPRYIYAGFAFGAGMLMGLLLPHLF